VQKIFVKFGHVVFGPPFVKRFALYAIGVLSVLSVSLSITLVCCGQTVRWIKMSLGTEVGLGPGHIVLDGDTAPPPTGGLPTERGTVAPLFGPRLLWPNGRPSQQLLSSC